MKQPGSLRRRADFTATLKRGRRTRSSGLTVVVAPRGDSEARLGLAVKASGAVVRNRVKRRLRAAFREAAPTGVDVVVKADASAGDVPFQELVEALRVEAA